MRHLPLKGIVPTTPLLHLGLLVENCIQSPISQISDRRCAFATFFSSPSVASRSRCMMQWSAAPALRHAGQCKTLGLARRLGPLCKASDSTRRAGRCTRLVTLHLPWYHGVHATPAVQTPARFGEARSEETHFRTSVGAGTSDAPASASRVE